MNAESLGAIQAQCEASMEMSRRRLGVGRSLSGDPPKLPTSDIPLSGSAEGRRLV
jgi:hypothetical protein